jgi:hypothetical protein
VAISERPAQRAPDRQSTAEDESERLVARVVRIAAAVAVAAVLVQVTSEFANYFLFDMDVWALNVDADDNAFAWASSVAQFTVAAFCLLLLLAGWWSPWPLLGLTAILAFFSLDDIVRIHEEVASAFRADVLGVETAWGRLVWPIIFLPLLAAAFVLLWRFSERAPALAGRATRIGLVMLVLAVFAEAFSTVFHLGEDQALGSLPDIVEVSIEESLELAAWILIAGALAATVLTSGRRTT